MAECISCTSTLRRNVTYVEAEFSPTNEFVLLSVLGPDLPSYHVLPVGYLAPGEIISAGYGENIMIFMGYIH